ncbi:MAG TPA: hypothetical protein VIC08_15440 [Cellvibrionaceae bacterium]
MNQHLIFSQPGVFRLQQLANTIYHQTGQRHRLSSEQGINQLLRAATKLNQPEIRSAFERFTQELNQHQLQQLSLRGIGLPGQALLTQAG